MNLLDSINLGSFLVLLGTGISILTFLHKKSKQSEISGAEMEGVKKDIEYLEKKIKEVKEAQDKNELKVERKLDGISNKIDELTEKLFNSLANGNFGK